MGEYFEKIRVGRPNLNGGSFLKANCSKKRKLEDSDYEEKRDGLSTIQANIFNYF